MLVRFLNGTELQRRWFREAFYSLQGQRRPAEGPPWFAGFPIEYVPARVEVEWIADPAPGMHNEYAYTETGYDTFSPEIGFGAESVGELPAWELEREDDLTGTPKVFSARMKIRSNLEQSGEALYKDVVRHELGHVVHEGAVFDLYPEDGGEPHAVDELIAEICDCFGGSIDDWNDGPWENRILEASCETFKDVCTQATGQPGPYGADVPPRDYPLYSLNRTRWRLPEENFGRWWECLSPKKISELEIGTDGRSSFSRRYRSGAKLITNDPLSVPPYGKGGGVSPPVFESALIFYDPGGTGPGQNAFSTTTWQVFVSWFYAVELPLFGGQALAVNTEFEFNFTPGPPANTERFFTSGFTWTTEPSQRPFVWDPLVQVGEPSPGPILHGNFGGQMDGTGLLMGGPVQDPDGDATFWVSGHTAEGLDIIQWWPRATFMEESVFIDGTMQAVYEITTFGPIGVPSDGPEDPGPYLLTGVLAYTEQSWPYLGSLPPWPYPPPSAAGVIGAAPAPAGSRENKPVIGSTSPGRGELKPGVFAI